MVQAIQGYTLRVPVDRSCARNRWSGSAWSGYLQAATALQMGNVIAASRSQNMARPAKVAPHYATSMDNPADGMVRRKRDVVS